MLHVTFLPACTLNLICISELFTLPHIYRTARFNQQKMQNCGTEPGGGFLPLNEIGNRIHPGIFDLPPHIVRSLLAISRCSLGRLGAMFALRMKEVFMSWDCNTQRENILFERSFWHVMLIKNARINPWKCL